MYRIIPLLLLLLIGCSKTPEVKGVGAAIMSVELTVSSVNSGTVTAEHEAELAFGTVGRVKSLNTKVGLNTKKGDVLSEIENIDLKTIFETAHHDLVRAKDLFKSRVVSTQDVEGRQRAFDLAEGNYEKSIIRAPFDGLITEINIDVGQLSQITAISPKPLIKIVDLEPRYIEAEIDEVDLPRVTVGLPTRVKILAVRREPFKATVRRVVPYISSAREQDRTSLIELNVDSEGILLPAGASADVEIIAQNKDRVLAVPSRVVLGRGQQRYVFKYEDGRAVRTPVTVGIGNYDRTEIVEGLSENDIVLYPAENVELEDGSKVSITKLPWP